jgi:glycine cleavage system aminomethyltransferase T
MRVFDSKARDVGFVTSGTFAPSLGYAIGMALVDVSAEAPFSVDIRGTQMPFELTPRPFYRPEHG